MTKQIINIGSNPNDGTGDTLRTAFGKVNDNFTEVYYTAQHALPNSGGTIYGDMHIVGNLRIYGNTIYTTLGALAINTTSIIFNQDLTIYDEPVDNVSLLVNRGVRPNVTLTWNEISEMWTYTNDGNTYYYIPSNTEVEQVVANGVVMFNSANGIATNLTNVFAVTNSAYTFANTIYPYVNTSVISSNNYSNTIGSRANAFSNVIGSRANAWANVIGTIANNYSIYITELVGTSGNNWSNVYSNNVGVYSNTYCNVSTLSSNNYSGYMANAVNAYVNVSTLSANNYGGYMANGVNAYVNVSTLSSNNYSGYMANAVNAYVNVSTDSANNYSGYMANAVNAYANVVGISGNVYVNVSTDAANNYSGYMANAVNAYANVVGASGNAYVNVSTGSANNWANTKLANTTGTFQGDLTVTGNVIIQGIIPSYSTARPAFRVVGGGTTNNLSTTQNGTGALTANNFTVDYNQGNHLITSNGTFIAPVAGLYQVSVVGRNSGYLAGYSQLAIHINNSSIAVMVEWGANSSMDHVGGSSVVKLAAGDILNLKVMAGQINFDNNDNWSVAYIG